MFLGISGSIAAFVIAIAFTILYTLQINGFEENVYKCKVTVGEGDN